MILFRPAYLLAPHLEAAPENIRFVDHFITAGALKTFESKRTVPGLQPVLTLTLLYFVLLHSVAVLHDDF